MAFANQFPADVKIVGDMIAKLSLSECVLLEQYLQQSHIHATFAIGEVKSNSGFAPSASGDTSSKHVFKVIFEGVREPAKKINVIKNIREITGLGLKEAKDLSENPTSKPIKENLYQHEAQKIVHQLEEAGGRARIS